MTDTALLKQVIHDSGLKLDYIANSIGISRQSLSKKINNVTSFNQYEIFKLCEILNITNAKMKEKIFLLP